MATTHPKLGVCFRIVRTKIASNLWSCGDELFIRAQTSGRDSLLKHFGSSAIWWMFFETQTVKIVVSRIVTWRCPTWSIWSNICSVVYLFVCYSKWRSKQARLRWKVHWMTLNRAALHYCLEILAVTSGRLYWFGGVYWQAGRPACILMCITQR